MAARKKSARRKRPEPAEPEGRVVDASRVRESQITRAAAPSA